MTIHKPILISCAFLFWGVLFGQRESPNEIKGQIPVIAIDLNSDEGIDPVQIEKYNGLKRGEFFRLRIDNVNTYLYDVIITNEDIERTETLPESLLDLVDFGGLKSALAHLNSVSEVVKEYVPVAEGLDRQALGTKPDVDDLQNYFASVRSRHRSALESIGDRYAEIDALFVRAENYQNTMTTVERNVLGAAPSKENIKETLTSFGTIKDGIGEIKKGLVRENSEFMAVMETNQEVISKNRELKASGAEIVKGYEILIKAADQLVAQLSPENYGQFSSVLIGILNNLDFSYSSLPLQRYSDVNELAITLKPRDKNAKLSGYSTVLRIPDIEQSFWGISTGFYATDNPAQNYSVVERIENGQTLYDFLEEDTTSVELGINTMVRYGWHVGKIWDTPTYWHFGFGAGLSIDQRFKPRLMAGTGLALGRKNKMFIDVGAVHMYYDALSKAYELQGNTVLPEDFLVNATQINGYISLGYLIGL